MKKILLCVVLLTYMLSGCTKSPDTSQVSQETNTLSPIEDSPQNALDEPSGELAEYKEYSEIAGHQQKKDSYTVGVICNYDMHYDDGSSEQFSMDGVLELAGIGSNPVARYSQNMNSNGLQFVMHGDYYNGRLYNTYNGVQYYEDHTLDQLKGIMLVPLDMVLFSENEIESLTKEEKEGLTVFTIRLTKDAARKQYLQRYDFSGLDSYQTFEVTEGIIHQSFDENGVLVEEVSDFDSNVAVKNVNVDITYHSSAGYLKVNSTEVLFSEETKNSEQKYVNFLNIDTNMISEDDITLDTVEATPEETLKKRLINRMKYTIDENGRYTSSFNDGESYAFDFTNKQFIYTNHSIRYVYNWDGDNGSFGSSCNYDFKTATASSSCQEEVVNMIQTVKLYFQMELYYCGLSLDDFVD